MLAPPATVIQPPAPAPPAHKSESESSEKVHTKGAQIEEEVIS